MDKAYFSIIKELSRLMKSRSKIDKNRNGQLILDESEIVKKYKEYIDELYEGSIEEN